MATETDNNDDLEGGSLSSETGTTSHKNTRSRSGPDEYGEMQQFQAKETSKVNIARRFVVASLLLVGAFVSGFIYYLLRQRADNEASDAVSAKIYVLNCTATITHAFKIMTLTLIFSFYALHIKFELFSNSIETTFKFQIESIFTANRALSRAITSSAFALNMNFAFPLFSVPAFESLAYEARLQGGFEVIVYAPISKQADVWLEFANETRGWLDTSKYLYDNLEPGLYRSKEPPVQPLPHILWDFDTEGDGVNVLVPRTESGFFVPILHVSPPPIPALEVYQNINLFSSELYSEVGSATIQMKGTLFIAFDEVVSASSPVLSCPVLS